MGRGIRRLDRRGRKSALKGDEYLWEVTRLRADHRRDRDQPGHRPVLGRAHARTRRARSRSTSPTRRGARSSGRRRRRPVSTQPVDRDDLRAARPRLLDQRRDGARPSTAAPTSRSRDDGAGTTQLRAARRGRHQHRAPAAVVRHRLDRGGPRRSRRSRLRPRVVRAGLDRAAGVHRRRSPTPTASTGATTRTTARRRRARTPSTRTAARASPSSARWSARCTRPACRSCSTRSTTTPRQSGQGDEVGARPGRAGLLPPAERGRRRRDLDLLPERRDRARRWRRSSMVDSVVLWARDYKVDGFRFDLMGHHSKAEHARRPRRARRAHAQEGRRRREVDLPLRRGLELRRGREQRAVRAGHAGPARRHRHRHVLRPAARRACAAAARSTRTRVRSRASARGSSTDPNGDAGRRRRRTSGDLGHADRPGPARPGRQPARLRVHGIRRHRQDAATRSTTTAQPAGYADEPDEVITYVDAHDNETLCDALTFKLPRRHADGRPRAHEHRSRSRPTTLSQTPSFWHAGADLLRSKSLDRNSYNSGDWFNRSTGPARSQRLRLRAAAGAPTTRPSGRSCSRCWRTRRSSPAAADIATAEASGARPAAAAVRVAAAAARLGRPDPAEGDVPGQRAGRRRPA